MTSPGLPPTPSGPPRPFGGPIRHVYVHVPFCRRRCDYCDFVSLAVGEPRGRGAAGTTPAQTAAGEAGRGGRAPDDAELASPGDRLLDRYVEALAADWERERAAHDVRRLETLYLGGGTPSLLGPDRLEQLLERFRPLLTPHAEVSVETNPEDVDGRYGAWAAGAGVRISLGAQSFSPALRAVLGRGAGADPGDAFRALRAAGVAAVGLDLIHGIPGQSPQLLAADIAAVLALRPDHVSWYELDVVEGTALARRLHPTGGHGRGAQQSRSAGGGDERPAPDCGEPDQASAAAVAGLEARAMPTDPGDDARAEGYRRIVRALTRAGYRWYEVSNFALPGRRARHNVAYWRARPYLGLGPGAVSTVGPRRWREDPDVRRWLAALEAGGRPRREREELDEVTLARERLLLAARCGLPVPVAALGSAYDAPAAATLAGAGLVSLHSGTIRVTRKGRYVANEVCVRLFRDTHLRG